MLKDYQAFKMQVATIKQKELKVAKLDFGAVICKDILDDLSKLKQSVTEATQEIPVNSGQSRLNVAYGAICIELYGAQAMGNSYALHRA